MKRFKVWVAERPEFPVQEIEIDNPVDGGYDEACDNYAQRNALPNDVDGTDICAEEVEVYFDA